MLSNNVVWDVSDCKVDIALTEAYLLLDLGNAKAWDNLIKAMGEHLKRVGGLGASAEWPELLAAADVYDILGCW